MNACTIILSIWAAVAIALLYRLWADVYRQRPTVTETENTIVAADAQTAKWMQWNQLATDETAIEPPLPEMGDCAIDDSPLTLDQDDRATVQALMLTKAIAIWLEGESTHYSVEAEIAIRQLAGSLRTQGIAVLEDLV